MHLYEITNGYIGESYVRAYAWAASEEEARQLYAKKNGTSKTLRIRELFCDESPSFCTAIDDSGWPDSD